MLVVARPTAVMRPSVNDFSGWWQVAHETCPLALNFWSKKKRFPRVISSVDFVVVGVTFFGERSLIFVIAIFSSAVVSGWARRILPEATFWSGDREDIWARKNSPVAGPKK